MANKQMHHLKVGDNIFEIVDSVARSGISGAPTIVSLSSAMSDTSKLYLYIGSETGYTNGDWYYHNGTSWVSGGQYGDMQLDTSLTISGMAADAKSVGDRFNNFATTASAGQAPIADGAGGWAWGDVQSSMITVDSELSQNSTNPVQNKVIYEALQGGGGSIIVDSALSGTSVNPVQNKVITQALSDNVEFIFPKKWAGVRAGDSNLVKYHDKTILIDCHGLDAYSFLEQMLIDNSISHIDYFILTHYHADHYGNIENLITDGYIDTDTTIYLPPDGSYLTALGWNENVNIVKGWLSTAGLSYVNATESTQFVINGKLKVSFYNCDASYFASIVSDYTNQNDYSILNLVEFGDTKAFFTGDAMGIGLERAVRNGFVSGYVDLYKMEHHGINHSARRTNEYASYNAICVRDLIKTITPAYAVQTSGTDNYKKNEFNRNYTMLYLNECGTKVFASHQSEDYIVFRSKGNGLNVISGQEVSPTANGYISFPVYVDISTNNQVQDGSENYPYKELSQAIANTASGMSPYFEYRYILADGMYNASHETPEKNMIDLSGVRIRIESASNDKTKVTIKNGCVFNNCFAYFNRVTLDAGEIVSYNSVVTFNLCSINNNQSISCAINAYRDSKLYLENTSFDTFDAAVYNSSSHVYMRSVTFANGTTALVNAYGGFYSSDDSLTYTNVTNRVLNTDYGLGKMLTSVTESPVKLKNVDLNDINEHGEYFCTNTTDAGTITNSPVSVSFSMLVLKLEETDGGRVAQIIYAVSGGVKIYVRLKIGSTFTEWYEFATNTATTTKAGLMSATDKANLDTLMSDYQSASTALG